MAPSFLAVGELMLDVEVARGRDSHAGRISVRAGGTAANAAVWAAAAGADTACCGRVGTDAAGMAIRAALAARGVADRIVSSDGSRTGTVARLAGELIVDRGANALLAPEDMQPLPPADALLVSGYALLHDDTLPAARAALERSAATWRAVTCGSAGLVGRIGSREVLERAAAANALFANEEEAAILFAGPAEQAARALGERFRLVCVTRGAAGAFASLDGAIATVAATRRFEGAARGAGDAFAAALLVALSRGCDLDAAAAHGRNAAEAAASSADGWPRTNPRGLPARSA